MGVASCRICTTLWRHSTVTWKSYRTTCSPAWHWPSTTTDTREAISNLADAWSQASTSGQPPVTSPLTCKATGTWYSTTTEISSGRRIQRVRLVHTWCSRRNNFVLYDGSGSPLWSSGIHSGAARVTLQDDGNLVIYSSAGKALWATGTNLDAIVV